MRDLSKRQGRPEEAQACRSPGDQPPTRHLHDLDRLSPQLRKVTVNLRLFLVVISTLGPLSLLNSFVDLHIPYILSYTIPMLFAPPIPTDVTPHQ